MLNFFNIVAIAPAHSIIRPTRHGRGLAWKVYENCPRAERLSRTGFVLIKVGNAGVGGDDRSSPPSIAFAFKKSKIFWETAMLKHSCLRMSALVLLIGLAPAARAGAITSVTQPSGPGGTGTTAIDTQYENYGIYSLLDVNLIFTSVQPISFSFDVDDAGGYTLHADSGFNPGVPTGIVNDTGQAWTGFVFSVDTSLGAGPNGLEVFNYFNSGVIGSSAIVLGDGIVPPGGALDVIFGVGTPAAMQVNVTFTPLSVPEPSSIVTLGLAVIGGATVYRRQLWSRGAARLAGR
jgi:hypothetical protein